MTITNPTTGHQFSAGDFVFLKGDCGRWSTYCTIIEILCDGALVPCTKGQICAPRDLLSGKIHLRIHPEGTLAIMPIRQIAHRLHHVDRLTKLIVTRTDE